MTKVRHDGTKGCRGLQSVGSTQKQCSYSGNSWNRYYRKCGRCTSNSEKGKTTLAKRLAAVTPLRHLEVGRFAEEHNCLGSYDDQLECFEIEEDKVGIRLVYIAVISQQLRTQVDSYPFKFLRSGRLYRGISRMRMVFVL